MPYTSRVENIVRKGEISCYNFSFFHNVFHSYISLVSQNAALCGNGLNEGEDQSYKSTQILLKVTGKYFVVELREEPSFSLF